MKTDEEESESVFTPKDPATDQHPSAGKDVSLKVDALHCGMELVRVPSDSPNLSEMWQTFSSSSQSNVLFNYGKPEKAAAEKEDSVTWSKGSGTAWSGVQSTTQG